MKTCPRCKKEKPDIAYNIHKYGKQKGQLMCYCRECYRQYWAERRSTYHPPRRKRLLHIVERLAWAGFKQTEYMLGVRKYQSPSCDHVPNRIPTVSSCYIKEARAMLAGKHWEGKNRCVKLPGDEEK